MAALKSLADPMRLLAFHCLLHIVHLSIRFGIKIAVPSFWEKHIRALYTWGARSVKRQHEFCRRHKDALSRTKDFLQVVGNVAEIHSWEWTYFDRYVIVRWETIVKCLRSALINWVGTRSVANVQRDSGWGPITRVEPHTGVCETRVLLKQLYGCKEHPQDVFKHPYYFYKSNRVTHSRERNSRKGRQTTTRE